VDDRLAIGKARDGPGALAVEVEGRVGHTGAAAQEDVPRGFGLVEHAQEVDPPAAFPGRSGFADENSSHALSLLNGGGGEVELVAARAQAPDRRVENRDLVPVVDDEVALGGELGDPPGLGQERGLAAMRRDSPGEVRRQDHNERSGSRDPPDTGLPW